MPLLTGLSDRERRVIYIALAVIGLFSADRLAFSPGLDRLDALNGEIISAKEKIREDRAFIDNEKLIRDESRQYQVYLKPAAAGDPATELASLIQKLAEQSGVRIEKGPDPFLSRGEKPKIGVKLECFGETKSIIQFIHRITYNESCLLRLERMTVTSKSSLLFCTEMIITQSEAP